jgi:DNA-directed RNA polymerase subunit K/omega
MSAAKSLTKFSNPNLDEDIEDVTKIIGTSSGKPSTLDEEDEINAIDSDAEDVSSRDGSKSQTDDDETDDDDDSSIDEDDEHGNATDNSNSDNEELGDDGMPKNKSDHDEYESGGIPKTAKQIKSAKKRAASKKNAEDDLTLLGVPHGLNFDDDDDEDDSDDDNDDDEYFQKLKSDVRQNFAETYHPESFSNNYDEIQTLSKVVRNSSGVIIDDLHRTVPFLTKYEKTRILGQRAKQINEGAPPLIKIDSTVIDGYLIAVKELEQKKTPFIIRRPLPNGGSEYWRVQDLEVL